MDSSPFFPLMMFGFDRSGTTLLSMMVGAHPDIAVPFSVTGLWYRYERRLEHYSGLASVADLERIVDDLLAEERICLWDVKLDREALLDSLPLGDYSAVVTRFHEAYARANGKPRWGNMDITTLDNMDRANRWFPTARFLHIVRDGRDVALSHKSYAYGKANTLDCAESWMTRVNTSLKMGAMIGPARYKVIRYEDLILDTENTLRGICEFAQVPYSAEMLHYEESVRKKVPEDRLWLWPALKQKPQKTKTYRWKQEMNPNHRAVFEGAARDLLSELGYEVPETPERSLPVYLHEFWCLIDRGARIQRLAARMGFHRGGAAKQSGQAKR